MSDLQIILKLTRYAGCLGPCWGYHVVGMGGRGIVLNTKDDVAQYALVDGAKACQQIIWC